MSKKMPKKMTGVVLGLKALLNEMDVKDGRGATLDNLIVELCEALQELNLKFPWESHKYDVGDEVTYAQGNWQYTVNKLIIKDSLPWYEVHCNDESCEAKGCASGAVNHTEEMAEIDLIGRDDWGLLAIHNDGDCDEGEDECKWHEGTDNYDPELAHFEGQGM